jgi:KUP system potassium uptake protein
VSTADATGLPAGHHHHENDTLAKLALGAVGVVYGDIGTSPLYAMKEVFVGHHKLAVDQLHIFGVVSLVFWSLVLIVTVKYVSLVMRADNRGEGGILALMVLAQQCCQSPRARRLLAMVGIAGACLFFGDGVITPAVSVLSAVEGLQVAAPELKTYVLPVATVVIIGLFAVQSRGTGSVGGVFGPVMAVWFLVIAVLGIIQITKNPSILAALSPTYGIALCLRHGWLAFVALGSVVLAVTGAEALYADMGHFGARPIRVAWT